MPKPDDALLHWDHLIENFRASSQQFYSAFEKAVAARAVPELHLSRVEHKESGLASAKREYLRMQRGSHAFDICAAPFGSGFFVSWWLTEPPLTFGFLYLIAFCFGLMILTGIMYGIGFAVGIALWGVGMGVFLSGCAVLCGVPLILWLAGSALRNGVIEGESTVLAIPLLGRVYQFIFAPPTYYSFDTALMSQKSVHKAVLEVVDCMTDAGGVRALSEEERKPIMKAFAARA